MTIKKLIPLALLLAVVVGFGIYNKAIPEKVQDALGGGSGTINQLDQWKSTTTPYSAITTAVGGKNIYIPFSHATGSSFTANTFCLTADTCIDAWPVGGGGGGGGMTIYVQNGGATLNTATTTLNFTPNSFTLVESPTDTFAIRVATTSLGLLTTNVAEGSNLYYLDSRARAAISTNILGLTYNNSTGVLATTSGYFIPTTTRATNWDQAFQWGNHASQGYITDGNTGWDNSYGLITSGQAVGTTTDGVLGQVPYWTGIRTLGTIATGTLTESVTGLQFDANRYLLGGSAALSLTAGYEIPTTTRMNVWDAKGNGTVTSVDMSVPLGLSISGNPITTSGTLALTLTNGYTIPSTTRASNWDTAFGWGNHASQGYITDGNTGWDNTYGLVTATNATSSITYATSTNLAVTTGFSLFGGGIKTTANDLCIQLTGSAALCDGTDATGGAGGSSISTSTIPNTSDIAYWTSPTTLGTIATGTLSESVTGLQFDASRYLIGGSAALSLTAGYEIPTTTRMNTWDTAFGWGNHASQGYITDGNTNWDNSYGFVTGSQVIGTTTNPTLGDLTYWNGVRTVGSVATGTLTETATGLSLDATRALVGGAAVLSVDSGYSIPVTNTLLATSTVPTTGNLAYWSGSRNLTSVATGTLTETVTGLNLSATQSLVGGASILQVDAGYSLASTSDFARINQAVASTSALSATTPLSYNAQTGAFSIQAATAAANGYLTSTDWSSFNGRVSSSSIDTSAELAALLTDETGTGNVVFSAGPTFTSTPTFQNLYVTTTGTTTLGYASTTALTVAGTASTSALILSNSINLFNGGVKTTANDLCIQLTGAAALCDGSDDGAGGAGDGRSNWFLAGTGYIAPTSTVGIVVSASSTIGGGLEQSGLTINGGATSTGRFVVATTSPRITLIHPTDSTKSSVWAVNQTTGITSLSSASGKALRFFGDGIELIDDSTSNTLISASDSTVTVNGSASDLQFYIDDTDANHAFDLQGVNKTLDIFNNGNRTGTTTIGSRLIVIGTSTLATTTAASSTATTLTVTGTFNLLGDIITNVATWFDTKIEALSNVVLAAASVWDFGGVGSLEIPNAANNTIDAAGEITLDTTDDQLILADGANTARVFGTDEFRIISVTMASSSPRFASGKTLAALGIKDGIELTQFRCYVDGGTSKVVNITDGTNDTETITCGTTMTSDTDVATNDTFTADELGYLEMGATTGVVDYLHFEAYARITRE